MASYLKYDRKIITDFSDKNIEEMYDHGYVFGRIEKGQMDQTASLRINLENFELTSENRRILRKTENLEYDAINLPIDRQNYDWKIHKLGKDFYDKKFGEDTFSANKIKELLTTDHNFNLLFRYFNAGENIPIGFVICVKTNHIIHYSYPFYDLDIDFKNLGMGMMLKAILWAKGDKNMPLSIHAARKYIYLGAIQRESDKYKLQFKGLELWDNERKNWKKIEI